MRCPDTRTLVAAVMLCGVAPSIVAAGPPDLPEFGITQHDLATLPNAVIASRSGLATNLAAIQRDAEAGNVTAASLMAIAYSDGWGIGINLQTGVSWLKRASDGGSTSATAGYAACLTFGYGVERDPIAGMALLTRVAGTPSGDAVMAEFKLAGIGTARDLAGAERLAKRSMENGSIFAGDIYATIQHMSGGDAQAVEILSKNALAGDGVAMTLLGDAYANGSGVAKDQQQSRYFQLKAAEAHDADGRREAGYMLTFGIGGPVDGPRGVAFLQQAADRGSIQAIEQLGVVFADGRGVPKDPVRAAGYFRLAAEAGNPDGEANYGLILARGIGVHKDSQQGLAWLTKAAEQGQAAAMNQISVGYNNGWFGKRDFAQAQIWAQKAIAAGSEAAQVNLATAQRNQQEHDSPTVPLFAQAIMGMAGAVQAAKSGAFVPPPLPVPTQTTTSQPSYVPPQRTAMAAPAKPAPKPTPLATPAVVSSTPAPVKTPSPVQYRPSFTSSSTWVPAGDGSMNYQVTVQNTGNANLQCFVNVSAIQWNVGSGVAATQIQSKFNDTATVTPLVNASDSYSWSALVPGSPGYTVNCHMLR